MENFKIENESKHLQIISMKQKKVAQIDDDIYTNKVARQILVLASTLNDLQLKHNTFIEKDS